MGDKGGCCSGTFLQDLPDFGVVVSVSDEE